MREIVTDAFVLGVRDDGERNLLVDLLTEKLGRVEARIVSGRPMRSKLAPHFNVGGFVLVRLVHKSRFTVTDALAESWLDALDLNIQLDFLKVLELVRKHVPFWGKDADLWDYLVTGMRESVFCYADCVRVFGYRYSEDV